MSRLKTDAIRNVTASVDGINLDTSGNVGLGTTSPNTKLHVEGTGTIAEFKSTNNNYLLQLKGNNSANYVYLGTTSSNDYLIANNTNGSGFAERLRIDSSGRLLLGTTTEGSTNADELTINTASGHGGMTIRNDSSSYGNIYFSDGTSGAAEYAGYFQYDHPNDSLSIGSGADLTLTLDSSHNATLAGRLYISHDLTITGTAPRIILTDTNNNSDFRINVDGGSFQIQDSTNSYANRFVIKSDGKIGIGDSSPQSKLAVSDAGSTADPVIMAHISGSNGGNLGFGLYSDVNSKYTFKVTNNGRVQVNDGIDFSLTSHASGMTSELLSDYEEGTFTPGFGRTSTQPSKYNLPITHVFTQPRLESL